MTPSIPVGIGGSLCARRGALYDQIPSSCWKLLRFVFTEFVHGVTTVNSYVQLLHFVQKTLFHFRHSSHSLCHNNLLVLECGIYLLFMVELKAETAQWFSDSPDLNNHIEIMLITIPFGQ